MIVHPQIPKLHLHISKSPPLVTFNQFNIFCGCIQQFSSLSKKRISTSSVKMRSIFILLPTYQPTFNLNFCISFSDVTFSIQAPRLVSFPSKFSYPRWIYPISSIVVKPLAVSAAITSAAPARKSGALISAPVSCSTPVSYTHLTLPTKLEV